MPPLMASLSKARLSGLVVSTMLCGHLLNPITTTTTSSLSTATAAIIGTALSSASAAAFNQWLESPFDAQMRRTQCRLLPSLRIMPPTAVYLAAGWGVAGVGVLAAATSGASAALSALTIFLYGAIYTPMKRWSCWNTAVGAVVGAIPPLIGWFVGGDQATMQAAVLPAILFAWQFPHFHSLSFRRRDEYARAGYWMWSVVDVERAKRSALLWSVALLPITCLSCYTGLTSYWFMLTSTPINGLLLWRAIRFYRHGDDSTAKSLFMTSLLHLPVLMALLLVHQRRGEK